MLIECYGLPQTDYPNVRLCAYRLTQHLAIKNCGLHFHDNPITQDAPRVITIANGESFLRELEMVLPLAKRFTADMRVYDTRNEYFEMSARDVCRAMQNDTPTLPEIKQIVRRRYNDQFGKSNEFY